MNAAETKVYRRLRNLSRKGHKFSGKDGITRLSEERFRAEHKAIEAREARTAPVYKSLRLLVTDSPQFAGVRSALSSVQRRPEPSPLPKFTKTPAPKSPRVRLGSIHVVDVPPFQSGSWSAETGPNLIALTADPNGNMMATIGSGTDASGNNGNGHASCWAGVGQVFTPASEGVMQFSASPSFSWNADWMSTWWRQAAGVIWIGQFISRFDEQEAYIDTPVWTQNVLFSFDDMNFADTGQQTGSNSGFLLQSQLIVEPAIIYKCWVLVGGSANADGYNSQSSAGFRISANLSSLMLDIC